VPGRWWAELCEIGGEAADIRHEALDSQRVPVLAAQSRDRSIECSDGFAGSSLSILGRHSLTT
jgi:hypothetical protein